MLTANGTASSSLQPDLVTAVSIPPSPTTGNYYIKIGWYYDHRSSLL